MDFTYEGYIWNWHHELICEKIQDFSEGKIKKLGIFIPPQHGKSELCSKRAPSYILGKNPNIRIAGISYSHTLSTKFNRDLQRIIDTPEYHDVFPNTTLNRSNVVSSAKGSFLRNSQEFEIVGHNGGYYGTGIGGALTGQKVDILIIDDPVKDAVEAQSPTIQNRNWEWYNAVAETRLHNDSQQLLIMTRWDVNDLAGLILKHQDDWEIVSIPAIKDGYTFDEDKRSIGEALWEERHSKEKILRVKNTNPKVFNSLYQQNPRPSDDVLIFPNCIEVDKMPNEYNKIFAIDFGFSNSECAILEIEIDKDNKRVYCDEVLYKHGINNPQIAETLYAWGYNLEIVWCDSEPKSIDELLKYSKKINAIGIKKFQNSVLTMILFLQSFKIHYTKRSKNFKMESDKYQWKINAEGKPINDEVDRYNHLFKALMYGVYGHLRQNSVQKTVKLGLERYMT